MNGVLTGVNQVGRMFCDYADDVFIQSALLVIVLFASDLLLRKRLRAIFRLGGHKQTVELLISKGADIGVPFMNSYRKCRFMCGAAPIPTLVLWPAFQPKKQI
jgi:hypothetical protein